MIHWCKNNSFALSKISEANKDVLTLDNGLRVYQCDSQISLTNLLDEHNIRPLLINIKLSIFDVNQKSKCKWANIQPN
jgi:hypothetical protein